MFRPQEGIICSALSHRSSRIVVGEFSAHASHENDISWDDFKEGFRGAHIPKSIMKIKKREFDDLKQRNMTVSDYNSQFTLLSRYANEEHMTEIKKMEKFLDGLAPALKCQLVVHTFPDFKHWWTRPLLWKMRDAVWKISASEKGTRLITLAITEARQIFKRVGHTNSHPMSHAQSRIFMQGTRNSPIAPALLVTLVEKKGTMPNSAPSQGTQPQSQTTATIPRPSETISIPTITTGRVI